jgi:hypothetical protein
MGESEERGAHQAFDWVAVGLSSFVYQIYCHVDDERKKVSHMSFPNTDVYCMCLKYYPIRRGLYIRF